jgi:hypothetical protein
MIIFAWFICLLDHVSLFALTNGLFASTSSLFALTNGLFASTSSPTLFQCLLKVNHLFLQTHRYANSVGNAEG